MISRESDGPAVNVDVITPNNDADLSRVCVLWVGVLGNVAVIPVNGTEARTFVGVQGLLPVRVKRVLATGTTATSMLGLY